MEQAEITEQSVVRQKFRRFLFLHRVAFICNVFFVVCLIIRYTHADNIFPQPIVEIAALLGWIFSPVINVVCVILSLIVVLKRGKGISVSWWLIAANIFIFICEIIYFFLS